MEYVYAAMMLNSAGQEINEENISKVLEAADSEVDEARVKALTTALEDVDIEEAIQSASVSTTAPSPAPAEAGAEEAEEEAPEEEEEEAEEAEEEAPEEEEEEAEEGAAGLGDLFE